MKTNILNNYNNYNEYKQGLLSKLDDNKVENNRIQNNTYDPLHESFSRIMQEKRSSSDSIDNKNEEAKKIEISDIKKKIFGFANIANVESIINTENIKEDETVNTLEIDKPQGLIVEAFVIPDRPIVERLT
ncbi:MAG: Unknown protein [uncultured Sulfurovum sp.]|uniref:Uncharacterized protein n=1 Tax=uncultured Sulfurovum sp. TaxID=269237 RepID=A0A6S6T2I7_9BACT|nr:MAG: Unknown protein [uncultured Sulfurovum sp.]